MQGIRTNKLAQELLDEALAMGASDMHVEPVEQGVRVRIRVDGLLQELRLLPAELKSTLLTQLKVSSGMDIAERRVPQDGRMVLNSVKGQVDLRLSSLPTINGEKLAIRFLQRQDALLQLDSLYFTPQNLACYRSLFTRPNGLVLLTGPTGSGKTTTLYATLQELDAASSNIITLEDPVEYKLDGINQVAVNRKSGMTFASALRAVLRQDPDIIMLGEIRDEETAVLAVQAALTGHLVLSTLHTNDAVGAIFRLLDMGIADYLLAASLRGVLAQRLVRRPCPHCSVQRAATAAELHYLGRAAEDYALLTQGTGCTYCHGTGYSGRVAVHEVMIVDKAMQHALVAGANEADLLELAAAGGWHSLATDGAVKALQGLTTVQELWRVGIAQVDRHAV
jgi:type IV pilus assembly protein PilB